MGRDVGPRLAARFARAILELGGNNAAIVAPSADLDLAVRAIAFAAMGTAGQRCTTLRRLFVHNTVYERLVPRLYQIYAYHHNCELKKLTELHIRPDTALLLSTNRR